MNPQDQDRFDSLYQQHINALILQGKRPRTIEAYSRSLRQFSKFFDCCPDHLSQDQLKTFFLHVVKTLSWSQVKIDRNAIQSFYRHVLKRPWKWVEIIKPPKIQPLQDVLSINEVTQLINKTQKLSYQVFYLTTYSLGLRLGEGLALTIKDIDAELMRVHIRCGKGNKDRFIPLPFFTLKILRHFWKTHQHPSLIFPGGTAPNNHQQTRSLDRGGLQKIIKIAATSAGINKNIHIHSLRHSYATHLIEAGLNLHSIQLLLGHASPVTTARYLHLTEIVVQNSNLVLNELMDKLAIEWSKKK